jgi:hypothetical protein
VNSLPYIHEPNLGTSISVVIIPHSYLGTVPLSASGSPHHHLLLPLSGPSTDISEALDHCHCSPTARAGASLSLVARTKATLDGSKDAILREHPSAQVLTFPADVRDVKKAEEVVDTTVARFGRLDILVANAGTIRPIDKRAFSPHTHCYRSCS